MIKRFAAIFATVCVIAVGAYFLLQPQPIEAAKTEWLTDLQKAQEQADKEKKDLLINFTGSDWCGWCIKLREEVFNKKDFEEASEHYVLVKMDFPNDKSLVPAKTQKQNELWSNKFGIEGFPTIVLTDAQARPYASLGYVAGGPPAFLTQLKKVRKHREARDVKFAKANKAQGVEKAKLLSEALDEVPEDYRVSMYRAEVKEIIALDAQDKAGLKSRFTLALQQAEADEHLQKLQTDVNAAFGKGGEKAVMKVLADALASPEAKTNPIIHKNLLRGEIGLLMSLKKYQDSYDRFQNITKDKAFTEKEVTSLGERLADNLVTVKQTELALKTYDWLIAKSQNSLEDQLSYQMQKATIFGESNRPQEALAIFEAIIQKTKKGERYWIASQSNKGGVLMDAKKPKEAAKAYDEILTVETLEPARKLLVLVDSAEAHHAAKQTKEAQARIKTTEALLKDLTKSGDVAPGLLEHVKDRLGNLTKSDKKPPADKKTKE